MSEARRDEARDVNALEETNNLISAEMRGTDRWRADIRDARMARGLRPGGNGFRAALFGGIYPHREGESGLQRGLFSGDRVDHFGPDFPNPLPDGVQCTYQSVMDANLWEGYRRLLVDPTLIHVANRYRTMDN